MADIAFLLLVFFLVTTVFDEERGLSIVLPQDTVDVPQRNVLHLVVRPDGLVEIRRGENPSLIAAVKTEPQTGYGRMIDVLDQLQTAGAQRISLQAMQR